MTEKRERRSRGETEDPRELERRRGSLEKARRYDPEIAKDQEAILQARLKGWSGTNLSEAQHGFMEEVARRDARDIRGVREGVRHERLNQSRSDRKGEVKKKLRAGLADLAALSAMTYIRTEEVRPWFTEKDAKEAFDKRDLCAVIGYAVDLFGDEYADAVLSVLGPHYARKNEKIVVHREIRD